VKKRHGENRMTPIEVAQRLVELCRQGAYETAQSELYAAEAVSIEPEGSPTPTVKGIEAIAAKGKHFAETFEVHGGTVSDAVVAGPFFSLSMAIDATPRAGGPRFKMEEICVYEVRDGKIVREQFFYPL
jgi:hypothetical protein